MAAAINFKPYLVFSLLPFLGRRADRRTWSSAACFFVDDLWPDLSWL